MTKQRALWHVSQSRDREAWAFLVRNTPAEQCVLLLICFYLMKPESARLQCVGKPHIPVLGVTPCEYADEPYIAWK